MITLLVRLTVILTMQKLVLGRPLNWQALREPSGIPGLTAEETLLSLPTYYERGSDVQSFGLHVVKVSRGAPKTHLILLAGGPGQKGTYYLSRISPYVDNLRDNFVIYMPTHRGLGKSGKLASAKQFGWHDLGPAEGKLPLSSLTVRNAAKDVVELSLAIKASQCYGSDSRLFLYGSSYGGLWGTRVLKLAPTGLFEAFLMNSPFVIKHFMDPHNDRDFLHSCGRDQWCREQVDGHPAHIRNAVSFVGSPNFNLCCKAFHEMLEELGVKPSGSRLANEAGKESWSRMHAFLRAFLFSDLDKAMATVPLVNHLYKCPSPQYFRERVIPVLMNLYNSDRKLRGFVEDSVTLKPPSSRTKERLAAATKGTGDSINLLANFYIMASELYDLPHSGVPEECRDVSPYGLLSDCPTYWRYRKTYEEYFEGHPSPSDTLKHAPLMAGPTRIYIYHSSMDTVTPLPSVEAFYADIQGSGGKRLLISENRQHSRLMSHPCAKHLFNEVFHGASSALTDGCMRLQNLEPVDWQFKGNAALQTLWIPSHLGGCNTRLPEAPNSTVTRRLSSRLPARSSRSIGPVLKWPQIAVLVTVILLVLIAFVFAFYKVCKRCRAQDKL